MNPTVISANFPGPTLEQIICRMPRKGRVFKELFSHLSQKGKVYIAILNNIPQGMNC